MRSRRRVGPRSRAIARLRSSLLAIAVAGAVPAVVAGCGGSAPGDTPEDASGATTGTSSAAADAEPDVSEPAAVTETDVPGVRRVLGDWQAHAEIRRRYVLIDPGLDDAGIVDIATRLHALEPDLWYHLMDDERGYDAMVAALPATRDNDYSAWPRDYVDAHLVARVVLELRGDGAGGSDRVWVVEGGAGRRHLAVDLP